MKHVNNFNLFQLSCATIFFGGQYLVEVLNFFFGGQYLVEVLNFFFGGQYLVEVLNFLPQCCRNEDFVESFILFYFSVS
jgi:hypothetical protein